MNSKNILLIIFFVILNKIVLSQNWVQISDFPSTERDDGTSFVLGNKAFCGTGLKTGWITCSDMYSFNILNETWDTIASLPTGMERQYATAFSSGNFGFIFGGVSGTTYFNDLWMYDTTSGNWLNKTSLPGVGRMGMCNFVINDTAYILGGSTATSSAISEFWAYSIASDTWTFKGNLPFGERWRASATSVNSKGYIIFGRDSSNNYRRELYEFNPILNSWNLLSNFPNSGRIYSTLQNFNNSLILVAGLDSISNSYNDMWHFELISSTWQQLASIPSNERRGGMCFTSSTSIYYTAGIDLTNLRLKETWKVFNPALISEFSVQPNFTIFPNPAHNMLHLEFESSKLHIKEIEIINVLGQVVKVYNYETNSNQSNRIDLDLNSISSGIYFVQVLNKENIITKRFIKK